MKRKRLLWHIYPPLVLVIIIALVATSWYASSSMRIFFLDQTADNLKIRARFILKQVEEPFISDKREILAPLCRAIGQESATRVTLILKSGEVAADSDEQAGQMDNHADRIEISQALIGQTGSSIRYSHTLQQNMLYVAIPIFGKASVRGSNHQTVGVLRLSLPVTSIDEALHQVYAQILLSAIVLIFVAALITLVVSRRISRPIEKIRHLAERFAQGDLTRKIVFGRDKSISLELDQLATAMNKMARQLDNRIRTVTGQRNELEAVFTSMVEAVLVIDMDERFLSVNKAALDLLGLKEMELAGRSIVEIVRNPDLLKFIRQSLALKSPMEDEVVLHESGNEIFLHGHGTSLRDGVQEKIGCLVVLNDVTRLRRLEKVRSDFVANVSHELKTPITAIKGFVETLQDGAMADPASAGRFIEIILKHANRLNAIVDDLLTLSRIEQEEDNRQINLERSPLDELLADAVEACTPKATAKDLAITVTCPANLMAAINSPLLQQAVTNLIINAVKYSDQGSQILVAGQLINDSVVIRVEDFGVGIASKHLPRLFERFYRSDNARSRKLGGTGLGLAIVKHIVQAHHGQVEVASSPGAGTVFTITIPVG